MSELEKEKEKLAEQIRKDTDMLNKLEGNPRRLRRGEQPKRNELCPCGSKLKHKYCHGDVVKNQAARAMANKVMAGLIFEEQKAKGIIKRKYTCECGKEFDVPKDSVIADIKMCPLCSSTKFTNNYEKGVKV